MFGVCVKKMGDKGYFNSIFCYNDTIYNLVIKITNISNDFTYWKLPWMTNFGDQTTMTPNFASSNDYLWLPYLAITSRNKFIIFNGLLVNFTLIKTFWVYKNQIILCLKIFLRKCNQKCLNENDFLKNIFN